MANNKLVNLDNLAQLAEALDARMIGKVSSEELRALEAEADLQQAINEIAEMFDGKSFKYLTQAEYDALPEKDQDRDDVVYIITDAADISHIHANKEFLDSLDEEAFLQMSADIIALQSNKVDTTTYNNGINEVKGLISTEESRALGVEADLLQAINGKSPAGHSHDDKYYTETEIDEKFKGVSPSGHNHDDKYYTEVEIDAKIGTINTALDGKSPMGHDHDDRYYTETEINSKIDTINEAINGRSLEGHTHTLLSMKIDNYKTVSDEPSTYERGESLFFINAPEENFNGLQYGLVQTLKEYSSGNAAWQFLYPYNAKNDKFYVRNGQYGETGWRSWAEVYTSLNKPSAADIGASPSGHNHDDKYYTEVEVDAKIGTINTALDGKSPMGHDHDDRYYTESEIDAKVNTLTEADSSLQSTITTEVGRVETMLGGKSFVYLTQSEYDALPEEQKKDTSKIHVVTDANDPTHEHVNKEYLDTLAPPTVVDIAPSGTTLALTADKYQKADIVSGTLITFPSVSEFTEIHLYFDAESAMNLSFPDDCRVRVDSNIEAGKSYELIATYNTVRWLVNILVYS